jgi:hypothetical protein
MREPSVRPCSVVVWWSLRWVSVVEEGKRGRRVLIGEAGGAEKPAGEEVDRNRGCGAEEVGAPPPRCRLLSQVSSALPSVFF